MAVDMRHLAFFQEFFQGEIHCYAIFLLFSDKILGRTKSLRGQTVSLVCPLPPLWKKGENIKTEVSAEINCHMI